MAMVEAGLHLPPRGDVPHKTDLQTQINQTKREEILVYGRTTDGHGQECEESDNSMHKDNSGFQKTL